MELWDLYTGERVLSGKTMTRGEGIPQGYYHLVVHLVLFNSKGEMLVQHRQPFKSGWPDMWDVTVGGSSVAGETTQEAVARETREEIGLDLDFTGAMPVLTKNFEGGFDDIYIVNRDVDLDSLTLQYEEVAEVKWASLTDVLRMLEDGEFIPYRENFIKLLFDLGEDRRTVI